ncbi:TetR/AcrR family transcriptional regulator [Propylenella binzhouense]|uniref:TetR/AcrR family transcriptional regulator n=1 Tax=Propylenella binzhouense TaxID=2555902 RepID=A0A964WV39_9HYPH|nr:TetR/AcrR family transcriptional regulator [Propylenella binzhouense]MYZ49746.1 TetR/AcrR family transcriptional regulator [Propylenella binzhouense]
MESKRVYRKERRARSEDETRRRIVEAAMRLHEEVGPRATTISAIAARASVQRLTVYRHFADETAIFRACTSHWLSVNPPPDPASWGAVAAPLERLEAALSAFYSYYRATEAMWAAAHRDLAEVPALQEPMAAFARFLAAVADGLFEPFGIGMPAGAPLRATIRHALDFPTWAGLDRQRLPEEEKVALVLAWAAGAAATQSRPSPRAA